MKYRIKEYDGGFTAEVRATFWEWCAGVPCFLFQWEQLNFCNYSKEASIKLIDEHKKETKKKADAKRHEKENTVYHEVKHGY
jgi:hypothetical protein